MKNIIRKINIVVIMLLILILAIIKNVIGIESIKADKIKQATLENKEEIMTLTSNSTKTVRDLAVGDYIYYDTGISSVGNNGIAEFIVLYNDSEHGVQIISKENLEEYAIGGETAEEARDKYNNYITTLNEKTEKYINSKYALDARCVGSLPNVDSSGKFINKNSENMESINLKEIIQHWDEEYKNEHEEEYPPVLYESWMDSMRGVDENYESDRQVLLNMKLNKNINIEDNYWYASRYSVTVTNATNDKNIQFGVRVKYTNPDCFAMFKIDYINKTYGPKWSETKCGIHPCISLNTNTVKIKEGNGSSSSPYTLGLEASYKVEYYQQNIDLKTYTRIDTENKTGIIGEQTNAKVKTYTGFTVQAFEQKTIVEEGNTIVIIYYNRNKYNVMLNPEEGSIPTGSENIEYTYGEEKTLPEPTRPGYNFDGWYDSEGNKVEKITATDTGNKELTAGWTARTDTKYTQEWYYQNETLDGYELTDTEIFTGTTGENARAVFRTVMGLTGWTLNNENTNSLYEGTIAGDGSLVLKVYYDRDTYGVKLNTNGGTLVGENITSYTYGIREITLPSATKEGHKFLGWWYTPQIGNEIEPVESIKIEKILKNTVGTIDAKARWERDTFTVTFKNENEIVKTETVNSGESATAPSLSKLGYILSWDKNFTNVTSDLIVNTKWIPKTNTPYKIVHDFGKLDIEVEGYNEEESKVGTTGTTVVAEYKEVEGFTKNESDVRTVKQGTISGDGSLVLRLYYTRNIYDITYVLNGGTTTSSLTNKYVYGKEIILQTNRVTKQGYTFAGWYDNIELSGSPVTSISATSIGNKTFYAKWVDEEQEYYILSEKYSINLIESTITKVSPETTVSDFLSKIETKGQKKVVNARGQEITTTSLVGTGYKLQVTFKGETYIYEIAVRGDLDGNGKITTTDLSIINQQILHKIELVGIKKEAADCDFNGRLTTTDLSMINQAVLRKITL